MEVNKKEKNQVCPYNFKEAVIAEKNKIQVLYLFAVLYTLYHKIRMNDKNTNNIKI